MNIAFTVVQNDMIMLKMWLSYYAKIFDKLYVLCYYTKDKYNDDLEQFKNLYNVEFEKRLFDELDPVRVLGTLNKKQAEFAEKYNWVLYTNCDEYLVVDPKRYKRFKSIFRRKDDWIPCEAYTVIQNKGEPPIDYNKPILMQRRYWIKDPHYNKILLSKVPIQWKAGQHKIEDVTDEQSRNFTKTGLYLIHLRHIDTYEEKTIRDLGPFKTVHRSFIDDCYDEKQVIPDEFRVI